MGQPLMAKHDGGNYLSFSLKDNMSQRLYSQPHGPPSIKAVEELLSMCRDSAPICPCWDICRRIDGWGKPEARRVGSIKCAPSVPYASTLNKDGQI